jgi:folylpolyglutamate synthase/dihydropteroate synthase
VAETLEEALDVAERAVTREDLICITGSFYLVGKAKLIAEERYKLKAAEAH